MGKLVNKGMVDLTVGMPEMSPCSRLTSSKPAKSAETSKVDAGKSVDIHVVAMTLHIKSSDERPRLAQLCQLTVSAFRYQILLKVDPQ